MRSWEVRDGRPSRLRVSAEVQEALEARRAVVALESTLISHGLPYPQNLETAQELEAIVRRGGAVPATIAVLDGWLRVGLEVGDLERLASGDQVRKVTRRDLPVVVAQGGNGATTVAATMVLAALVGIRVFATGGIGGVHRGHPFDISADLPELAHTPVVVVCAGAKAILDLPLTLEWLETHGVPVLGYGTDTFPAFYARSSGLPVDARVDTSREVADVVWAKWDMGLRGGVLVTVPVPIEEAMPTDAVESAIESALAQAEREGVRGRAVTPFLLARIAQLTGGESLQANVALLRNNAAVATEIAGAIAAREP
jgi:pseudouridine-5'-phosphate glycosidase